MPPTSPLTIEEALATARETKHLVIDDNALEQVAPLFSYVFPGRPARIIADPNTFRVAGEFVQSRLKSAAIPALDPFILTDPQLYAETRFVNQVEAALTNNNAIAIAVGSGTINDLTKLAAHRQSRQYLCVATAASMDGYTAFGASITDRGSKQTFDCPAPVAVVADLDVMRSAPTEMRGWGYADLFAKVTAGADWIIADALDVERIDSMAWNVVQGRLHDALRDPNDYRSLVEGLMLGGFAMQATRTSRPASGAEHQFSHLWDMQHHTHNGKAPSHGAKVAIGTLAITALYEALLDMNLGSLDIEKCVHDWPNLDDWIHQAKAELNDDELGTVAQRELTAKHSSPGALRTQLQQLMEVWPELQQQLRDQLVPLETLRARLKAAGAPTTPQEIGISRERLRATYRLAFFIRRRFTVLDLAMRTGLLNQALDRLFAA
ncbi:MAG: sn-glycerol-1-phosphate dehydrogenase [Verrucomicrobiaceae bacterium]|nr:sn-glycerol-1-phosphate dehydrogenase [Verrucomicrobiaceae bacterium]